MIHCKYAVRYERLFGVPTNPYYITNMNHYIELKSDSLDKLVETIPKVLIMVGSSHCPSCKEILGEKLNTFAKDNTDVVVIYVDSFKFPKSVEKFLKIPLSIVPTFVYYVGNEYMGYLDTVTSLDDIKKYLIKK